MTESAWTHLGIAAGIIIPVFLMWWDNRRHTSAMHMENRERMTRIETMLEPIWKWWNNGRDK